MEIKLKDFIPTHLVKLTFQSDSEVASFGKRVRVENTENKTSSLS